MVSSMLTIPSSPIVTSSSMLTTQVQRSTSQSDSQKSLDSLSKALQLESVSPTLPTRSQRSSTSLATSLLTFGRVWHRATKTKDLDGSLIFHYSNSNSYLQVDVTHRYMTFIMADRIGPYMYLYFKTLEPGLFGKVHTDAQNLNTHEQLFNLLHTYFT